MKGEHLLPKKCSSAEYSDAKYITGTSVLLVAFLLFFFWKKSLGNAKFSGSLLLKEPIVVSLSETLVLSSRKYEGRKAMNVTNLQETLRFVWLLFSVFVLE